MNKNKPFLPLRLKIQGKMRTRPLKQKRNSTKVGRRAWSDPQRGQGLGLPPTVYRRVLPRGGSSLVLSSTANWEEELAGTSVR